MHSLSRLLLGTNSDQEAGWEFACRMTCVEQILRLDEDLSIHTFKGDFWAVGCKILFLISVVATRVGCINVAEQNSPSDECWVRFPGEESKLLRLDFGCPALKTWILVIQMAKFYAKTKSIGLLVMNYFPVCLSHRVHYGLQLCGKC